MQRILRRLPIALGGLILGIAISACGESAGPRADAPAPAEDQAVVLEASPTPADEPLAESPAPAPAEDITQVPGDDPALQPDRRGIQPSIDIGQITGATLMALGGGGCGMTLYGSDRNQFPEDQGFVFSNGLDEDSMRMKINGSILQFRRIDYSGEPFYGQYLSQTFQNDDQGIQVFADVVLGEPGEIESVAIESGTLGVEMDGIRREFAVVGDAGC